jgi:hypothetical protein
VRRSGRCAKGMAGLCQITNAKAEQRQHGRRKSPHTPLPDGPDHVNRGESRSKCKHNEHRRKTYFEQMTQGKHRGPWAVAGLTLASADKITARLTQPCREVFSVQNGQEAVNVTHAPLPG